MKDLLDFDVVDRIVTITFIINIVQCTCYTQCNNMRTMS